MPTRSEETKGNNENRLSGFPYALIAFFSAAAILLCINQIFHLTILDFMPIGNSYFYYILMFYLSLSFIIFPGLKLDKNRVRWYDWVLFGLCFIVTLYLALNGYNILTRGWEYSAPLLPTAASFILWFLSLEATRRAGGTGIFLISLVFSVYPIFAGVMPGFLWGASFSLSEVARYHAMSVDSIIGIPIRVVGNLLVGFIIFGVALVSSGGGKFFMDFALSLMGSRRGGSAKVSVISSALMASLSGSVISNVVTTGSVTIPAMKRSGYKPEWAGAIEACSSTGGSIMPPIMGAAGFLIASFLNIPYSKVMIAAFFPAFLYYFTLLLQVDAHAGAENIGGLPKKDLPKFWVTVKMGWFYIGALVLLVFILVYLRVESWAPFFTMIFLFACAMIRKDTRYNFKKFVAFLVDTAILVSQITAILAGVGLIIGALSGTGVANSFSRELVILAGGNAALLLIFGAIASFVLGIGMTVTACYVFLAIVLVPALVGVGLNEMACHLFVLYWGCLSYITPPVALGAITAATIAGSDNMKTAFLSMRLGSAKYIVPFLFVLSPTMILIGPIGEVFLSVATAIFGCILLAASLEGYLYLFGKIFPLTRVLIFISSILFLYPKLEADILGAAIFILSFIGLKIGLLKYSKPASASHDKISNIAQNSQNQVPL